MKQKIFALAVMMLTLIFSATTFAATVSYDATLNGHKYKIFNNGMTWDVAKTYCERLGGHLVTITSFAEQQVVEKLLQTKGTKNSYWAGAYRSNDGREYKPGQRFKWITGEVSDFNNFSANQPDNFQGNEDALMIYRNIANNRLGAWNDIKKDGTVNTDPAFGIKNFGFICEWDSTAPPPVTNIKGDANCDGRVDLVDIMDIVNYHNGKANNLKSTTNADVTKDGRIDESDAAIIKLIVVGVKIPDSFDGYSIDSKGNTHVYKVFNNGMTWQQARDYCKNQGGHLVTITSQDEQGEIDRRIQLNGNKNSYWIGGCKSGGTWKWITGEAVAYTHMAAGQPDGDGNALMAYRGRNALGWWNDVKSDGTCNGETFFGANNFGFICEWDTAQDKNIVMDTPEGKPLPANFQLSNYSLSSPANYQLRFSGRVWNANNQSERTGIHVYIGGGVGAGGQFIGEFGSDSNHNFNHTVNVPQNRNGNQIVVIYAVNGIESKELDRRNINIAPAPSGFDWPIPGCTRYSYRNNHSCRHYYSGRVAAAIDISANVGTAIYAPANGVVQNKGVASGFGNWFEIKHDDGTITLYAHLSDYSMVWNGKRVNKGELIAKSGNTGKSTGPHLHFEMYKEGDVSMRPDTYFKARGVIGESSY